MNEIVKFSPYGGQLILEEVKGATNGNLNPENNVNTVLGADRDMYSYVPKSGCPHAKQAQVLMVLRDGSSKESAEQLMKQLQLDQLAEDRHFILLFPNPIGDHWNYQESAERDNDIQYLVRCFAALPKSKGKTAGFNGMIFYLATSAESSAMAMTLAATSPLDAAAIMISAFPEGYAIPAGKQAEQTAWIYGSNPQAEAYLKQVNHAGAEEIREGLRVSQDPANPNVRLFVSNAPLDAAEVSSAWDRMFSEARRWRNDVNGTYQARIDFTGKGFTAHVDDDSLGVNGGRKHTWYEYVPRQLRGTEEKVPLVFFFHGINCIALYAAEQSGWADLADRDGFIAVFPNPSIEERWNVWDDPRIPSDANFIMALIDHMKQVHPIDESRIYLSGFSMGSMFTNALACSYPEVFAGALACNGPHLGYLQTMEESRAGMLMFHPNSILKDIPDDGRKTSVTHDTADRKKAEKDYLMPFVQCVGLNDNVGFSRGTIWPLQEGDGDSWIDTIRYWQQFNHIPVSAHPYSAEFETGLAADSSVYEGADSRFLHQSWKSDIGSLPLYHLIAAKRMPHAIDLREISIGWELIRSYSRDSQGNLCRNGEIVR
jgi:poly(3-hydroxybutyrate) depolymerase